jgi:DNA-binding CsgD family transcriptional regulator
MGTAAERGHRTHVGWGALGAPAVILALIGTFMVLDLATNRARCTEETRHQVVEGIAALLALGGVFHIFRVIHAKALEIRALTGDLMAARAEASRWREETAGLMRGLTEAIDHQFERWELTLAEREIALLLIKGLSTREIAEFRATKEVTVRQQAQVVYRKAGLQGRAELAAYFLEDLLAPRGAGHGSVE